MGDVVYSKLGATYSKAYMQKKEKPLLKEINEIRRRGANDICAECGAATSGWASVTLGVFVCTQCSQIHRGLGAHISKVKSCMGTYIWCPDEVDAMRRMGNARARMVYCDAKSAPAPQPRPMDQLIEIAKDKYERKKWFKAGGWKQLHAEIDAAAAADSSSNTPPAKAIDAKTPPQKPAAAVAMPSSAPSAFAFVNAASAPGPAVRAAATQPQPQPSTVKEFAFVNTPPAPAALAPPSTPPAAAVHNFLVFDAPAAPKQPACEAATAKPAAAGPDLIDMLFGQTPAAPAPAPADPNAAHRQRCADITALFA